METILPGLSGVPNPHPIFIHFPIALWPTAVLFLTIGILRDQSSVWRAGTWVLHLGTLSAIIAIITGYIAADQLGHDSPGHGLVHTHRNIMITATISSTLVSAATFLTRKSLTRTIQWGLLMFTGVATLAAMAGADRGGEMVYRYSVGTRGETPPAADGHAHDHGSAHEDAPVHEEAPAHGHGEHDH